MTFQSIEALGEFILSGRFNEALGKGQTTGADAVIAIEKTKEALDAWKLVIQRGIETAQLVKEAT